MDDLSTVYEWAKTYEFDEVDLHYCTVIALKILDGECDKMDYDNYNLFMSVYEGICDKVNTPFNKKVHQIIALSRTDDPITPKKEYKEVLGELRKVMMKNIDEASIDAFKQLVWDNQD